MVVVLISQIGNGQLAQMKNIKQSHLVLIRKGEQVVMRTSLQQCTRKVKGQLILHLFCVLQLHDPTLCGICIFLAVQSAVVADRT